MMNTRPALERRLDGRVRAISPTPASAPSPRPASRSVMPAMPMAPPRRAIAHPPYGFLMYHDFPAISRFRRLSRAAEGDDRLC